MDKPIRVEEVFDRIMKARGWEKKDLAAHIGVHPSTLSSKLGTHWDAHWRVFLKLLPDLADLDIITVRDLHGHKSREPLRDSGGDTTRKAKTGTGR